MKAKRRHTREETRANMIHNANITRATADEMAATDFLGGGGCDDPLHPWHLDQSRYHDWIGFTEVVCRPIIEHETEEQLQAAMKLYRRECPHYIAASLVIALNRIRQLEAHALTVRGALSDALLEVRAIVAPDDTIDP